MARILMQALVGIDADGAGIGEPEGAPRPHPFADQVERQPLAQLQPEHLVEPGLGDIEHQQPAGDFGEDQQLMQEGRQIAPRQRVVEGLVPAVEQDLPERRRDDDGDDAAPSAEQHVAQRRSHEGAPHHRCLRMKTASPAGVIPAAMVRLPLLGRAVAASVSSAIVLNTTVRPLAWK